METKAQTFVDKMKATGATVHLIAVGLGMTRIVILSHAQICRSGIAMLDQGQSGKVVAKHIRAMMTAAFTADEIADVLNLMLEVEQLPEDVWHQKLTAMAQDFEREAEEFRHKEIEVLRTELDRLKEGGNG